MVIIHNRQVPVANHDRMKPGEVVERIKHHYDAFTVQNHSLAWNYFKIRPKKSDNKSENSSTNSQYCIYDMAHNDYTYSDAWVEKIIQEIGNNPLAAIAKWKQTTP
jgi:hypothetical protein